jgi:cation-transporting ATPase 13A1
MITGDNPLTACYVAQQLKMSYHPHTLIFKPETMNWESIDGTIILPFDGTPKK